MLQLSNEAAAVLGAACRDQGLSNETAGVRVAGEVDDQGHLNLEMTLEEEPRPTDEVTDQGEVRLFVAPEVAEPLANVEIDIAHTAEGPQLQLRERDQE